MPGSSISSLTIQIDVIGHASSRWRGAATRDQAERNNIGLSSDRARNVSQIVRDKLRSMLPSTIDITESLSARANGATIPVFSKGIGAKRPLLYEGPRGDNGLNRVAVCRLSYVRGAWNPVFINKPYRIPVEAEAWTFQAIDFDSGALGWGGAQVEFEITGPHGFKERFQSKLKGKGFDPPSVFSTAKSSLSIPRDYKPYSFTTNRIKFADFNNNPVRIYKAKVGASIGKVGFEVTDVVFSFTGLGGSSDSILMDFDAGLGGLSAQLGVYDGYAKRIGNYPREHDYSEFTMLQYVDETRLSLIAGDDVYMIMFETGKADISPVQRTALVNWVDRWAYRFDALNLL